MGKTPAGPERGAVEGVAAVRAFVTDELARLDRADLTDDAVLVASELATNALLHGEEIAAVRVEPLRIGARIEVHDRTRVPPMLAVPTPDAMTGRGLRLVASLSSRWSAEPTEDGKVVWAEVVRGHVPTPPRTDEPLDLFDDESWDDEDLPTEPRHHVVLGDVPTDLLVAAKTHVDNLIREFTLAASGALEGTSAPIPPDLSSLIDAVAHRFADARQEIKRQAVAAAGRGSPVVALELTLPLDAADAGEEYLRALDEADAYCRAARLLTLETPPRHRVFRQWYVSQLVAQLRAAASGSPPPAGEPFERRLLREIDVA